MTQSKVSGYACLAATIILITIGQLFIKQGILKIGPAPGFGTQVVDYMLKCFCQPFILAGLISAGLAAGTYMLATSVLPLTVAYPFMALPVVLVLILAPLLLHETVSFRKWVGLSFVVMGLWLVSGD